MQFAKYGGGRLIQNAEVTAVFLGSQSNSPGIGDWATDPVFKNYACRLNTFLDDILDSAYMDQLAQYNSPDGVYKIGRGRRVNSVFIPFSATQTSTLTMEDVQGYLDSAFSGGMLPASNDNSIYLIYLPNVFPTIDRFSYTSGVTGKDVAGGTITYQESFPPSPIAWTPFDYYAYNSTHQIVEIITSP